MIRQDLPKNAMQVYIKYEAYYDKKTNACKFKERDQVYQLQAKAYHQDSKNPVTDMRWIGQNIVEKSYTNNKYAVRTIGTNKMQIFHRIRVTPFAPKNPLPDVQSTSQEMTLAL